MKPLTKLNILQFLAAINENYFRALITFFLLSLTSSNNSASILSTTQGLFLIPFLLFSNLGGSLADKFSKQWIIKITRFIEFGIVLLCLPFMLFQAKWALLSALFLLAMTSSIFSPSKYSIITEIHPKSLILEANSLIASFTFLGIILGTGLTSFTLQLLDNNFIYALLLSIFIALSQIGISFFLPKTKRAQPKKKISPFIYQEFFDSISQMKQIRHLLPTFIAYGYFLFLGSFLQLGVLDYTIVELEKPAIIGGYYFLLCSIGTVIGSSLIKLTILKKMKLMMIPLSGFCLTLFFALIGLLPASPIALSILLILIGVSAGLILVPAQTFLLEASPDATRGRNFGSANVLSFLFALMAPLLIYLLNSLTGLSIRTSFIAVSLLNLSFMSYLFYSFKNR